MNFNEFKEKYEHKPVEHYPNQVTGQPVVSVCVQTYNHVPYIRECLEGILMQKTNFSIEILLGEDASTDGTREICLEYAKKYPDKIRLFLHHRENNIKINGSPSGRFNTLYNLYSAQGKYIALCEGDDYWTDPLKLQRQVDFLAGNEAYALCFHNAMINYEHSAKESQPFGKVEDRVYSGNEILAKWTIPTASVLFRKACLAFDYLANPNFMYGDIILFLSLAQKGKIRGMSELMSVYRIHVGGITQEFNKSLHVHKLRIKHFKELKKVFFNSYDKEINIILANIYIWIWQEGNSSISG